MTKVVSLTHVKASSVPAETRVARRIPWQGGAISSNKDEALRKFYQRKLQTGAQLTPQQLQAVQQLGIDIKALAARAAHSHHTPNAKNPKKKPHTAPHVHAKVTSKHDKHSIVINGRVLGPRVATTTPPATRRVPSRGAIVAASPPSSKPKLALHDQLDMPLDALVGKKNSKQQQRGGGKKQ